jgi:undecaprenyl-diphosphatase
MMDWSTYFLLMLYRVRTPLGVVFFSRLTEFGGMAVVILVLVVAAYAFWKGDRWAHALGLIVALGGSVVVSTALKYILHYSRPDLILHAVPESGYSFPSNHATAAMALYGFITWSIWELYQRWKIPATIFFGLLILGIGFSRLYLGVHFPADVAGGYFLGFLFVVLGIRVTRYLERFENLSTFAQNSL